MKEVDLPAVGHQNRKRIDPHDTQPPGPLSAGGALQLEPKRNPAPSGTLRHQTLRKGLPIGLGQGHAGGIMRCGRAGAPADRLGLILGAVNKPAGNDEAAQRAEIARQRDVIDAVDEQLLRLLNQRAEAALVIARAKRMLGLPIYDPVREQTILDGVRSRNRGPFEADAVSSLFERIIDETRRLERRTRGQDSPEEK